MSWNSPGLSLVVRRCGAPLLEREHPDTRADVGRLVDSQAFLRKLLVGRLTFAPETRADGRYVQITGTGTLGPLAAALGCPSAVASPTGTNILYHVVLAGDARTPVTSCEPRSRPPAP